MWARKSALVVLAATSLQCGAGNPRAVTSAQVILEVTPPETDHVTYLVGGDSRGDNAHVVHWAFEQAQRAHARAFLFLGDMEWSYGCDSRFLNEEVSKLSPIPFYPVVGNHEVNWFGFLR